MPALCWNRYRWAPLAVALVLGAGAARAATITVTIEKMAFSPTEVSARIGDTIEWVNKAGTVDYFCRFHPNMKGRIVVSQP